MSAGFSCVDDIKADLKTSFSDNSGRVHSGILEIVLGVEDLDAVREENIFAIEKIVRRDGYKEAPSPDATSPSFN